MKNFLAVLMLVTFTCIDCSAQSNSDLEKQNQYQKLKYGIDSKQFHFIAVSATNSKGKTAQLTGTYFVFLSADSLTVRLPFFGKAYSSTTYGGSRDDAGINFGTKQFTYTSDITKNGGWDITIKPIGQSSASKIYLSVFSNGSSRASVHSSNHASMSFYGTVNSNFKN
jgi:hypothetical protein